MNLKHDHADMARFNDESPNPFDDEHLHYGEPPGPVVRLSRDDVFPADNVPAEAVETCLKVLRTFRDALYDNGRMEALDMEEAIDSIQRITEECEPPDNGAVADSAKHTVRPV